MSKNWTQKYIKSLPCTGVTVTTAEFQAAIKAMTLDFYVRVAVVVGLLALFIYAFRKAEKEKIKNKLGHSLRVILISVTIIVTLFVGAFSVWLVNPYRYPETTDYVDCFDPLSEYLIP